MPYLTPAIVLQSPSGVVCLLIPRRGLRYSDCSFQYLLTRSTFRRTVRCAIGTRHVFWGYICNRRVQYSVNQSWLSAVAALEVWWCGETWWSEILAGTRLKMAEGWMMNQPESHKSPCIISTHNNSCTSILANTGYSSVFVYSVGSDIPVHGYRPVSYTISEILAGTVGRWTNSITSDQGI